MTPTHIGPFETNSFAAGLATATPLLLITAFFAGIGSPTVGATLAITGLALGAVAAGVFVAARLIPHTKENQ